MAATTKPIATTKPATIHQRPFDLGDTVLLLFGLLDPFDSLGDLADPNGFTVFPCSDVLFTAITFTSPIFIYGYMSMIAQLYFHYFLRDIIRIMFSENTRVKIPAIVQLTRLGYGYLSLKDPKIHAQIDPKTNIFRSIFLDSLVRINSTNTPPTALI